MVVVQRAHRAPAHRVVAVNLELAGVADALAGADRLELDLRLAEQFAFAGQHVITVSAARRVVAGEGVERFRIARLAVEAAGGADARQIDAANPLPVEAVHLNLCAGVLQVTAHQQVADEADALQRGLAFGNDFLPVFDIRVADVDGDRRFDQLRDARMSRSASLPIPIGLRTLLATPQTIHPGSLLGTAKAFGSAGRYCRSAK